MRVAVMVPVTSTGVGDPSEVPDSEGEVAGVGFVVLGYGDFGIDREGVGRGRCRCGGVKQPAYVMQDDAAPA